MARAKGAVPRNRRKKKIFKAAKGYFGGRKNLYRTAKDAVEKGWEHAYRDRKKKKRNFRRLWITRINAAAREHGTTYSQLIAGLKAADIAVDRKMLADLAVHDAAAFSKLAEAAKSAL